jgi:hypothetical protein
LAKVNVERVEERERLHARPGWHRTVPAVRSGEWAGCDCAFAVRELARVLGSGCKWQVLLATINFAATTILFATDSRHSVFMQPLYKIVVGEDVSFETTNDEQKD